MDTDIGGVNLLNECVWMKFKYLEVYMLRPGSMNVKIMIYLMAEIINGNMCNMDK